jgi:hypothetical protein
MPDDSQIYISGLYISGFSVYNMSRNACKIILGLNYLPIASIVV